MTQPEAGGFDGRQARALLGTLVREMSRGGTDVTTGAKGNQLVQIALAMSVMGLMVSVSALGSNPAGEDPSSFLRQVFHTIWMIAAFLVLPESMRAKEVKREILACRPISPRTFSVVQLVYFALITGICSGFFAVWPLGMAAARGMVRWYRLPGLLLAAMLGVFAISTLWYALALRIGRRWGMDRVRTTAQILLLGLVIAAIPVSAIPGVFDRVVSREVAPWLPPSWFADLALGRAGWPQASLALALVATAALVLFRLRAEEFYEADAARFEGAGRKTLDRHLLDACHGLPWLGRRWLPAPARAVADLVLRVISREDVNRLRGISGRAFCAIGSVVAFFEPFAGAAIAAIGLGSSLVEGLFACGQSADAAASWLFHAAPVRAGHRLTGVRWAIATRFAAIPMAILAVMAFAALPWPAAVVLTLALPVMVDSLICLTLLATPVRALGSAPALGMLLGCFTTQLASMVLVGLLAILVGLAQLGLVGLLIDAALIPLAALVGWGASYGAAQRLERMEMPAG